MFVKRLATASMLFATLSGCADQQETLIVTGAPAWSAMQEGGCFVDPNASAFLTFGVLDFYCMGDSSRCFGLSTAYYLPASLTNQSSVQQANSQNSGTDNSEIQLKEVDVSFSSPQAQQVIDAVEGADPAFTDFTLPLAADSLPSGQSKGVLVEAISPAMATELYNVILASFGGTFTDITIVASLVFHGERTGNTVGNIGDIASREFSFPIKLCFGCLQTCDGCSAGECDNTDLNTLTWSGGICGNAQDGPIFPRVCDM